MHDPRSPFDTAEPDADASSSPSRLRPGTDDDARPVATRDEEWGPRVRETLRDARIALAALKESLS